MVKKKNRKWRMCVDFTDLNKACPKDSFPLPYIDQLIDATAGHELLSFLDAYSGYNQILLAEEDQEKTTFITRQGIYCYKVMSFGLKNAGATYQRLVTKMFKEQLEKIMEVYIDDMLVKSAKKEDHISHLKEAFEILRRYGMKLNPEKCAFGVASGRFLGFLVSQRGIDVNPDQIKAIDTIPKMSQILQRIKKRPRAAMERGMHRRLEEAKSVPVLTTTRQSRPRNIARGGTGSASRFRMYRPLDPLYQWRFERLGIGTWTHPRSPHGRGLKLALKYGVRRLILHCDSQLVVNQLTGTYQIKGKRLQRYQSEIRKLLPEFDECRLDQIPRAQNMEADGLAKLAAATKNINKESVITLLHSAIDHIEVLSLNLTWDWQNRLVYYLQDGILPQDKKEAKKLRVQAARYSLVNHDLYKRTFGGPLAKCHGPHLTRQVLEEVHEGHCGAHTGNRTLVRCLIRAGYYWPTMKKEAADYIRRCVQCQKYAPMIHQAGELLHSVTSPWPFIKWGMDIVGPLPAGQGKVRMLRYVNRRSSPSYGKILYAISLEEAKGLRPELLPEVLWAHRTTPKSSTEEMPYSLVYGTNAVIPVEVGEPSLRSSHISGADNDESRLQDLDEIEKRRDMAHVRMIAQKQQMERYYNKKAKLRPKEYLEIRPKIRGIGGQIHSSRVTDAISAKSQQIQYKNPGVGCGEPQKSGSIKQRTQLNLKPDFDG
ncbi:PREDICTED: uncharacterized protein LOC109208874 [Nicotiana attenuata]|uniref:uncharacterized protein LOC109208874 n=1 Tax=Nicotiana attenuata TaxID=49451 RepID=UPI0009056181|nr:PREDICTED: uncharacterized protein LOC109208874 [Nicotiana attenuata]